MMSKYALLLMGIALLSGSNIMGQQLTLEGIVSDSIGPLPGATVMIKGTTRGIATDNNGHYVLKATAGDSVIFSFTGYQEQQNTVNHSMTLNIQLKESDVKLKEVLPFQSTVKHYQKAEGIVINKDKIEYETAPSTIAVKDLNVPVKYEDPLYVLDGVIISKTEFSSLQSENIASVNIIKNSENIFCSGRHNVIVITSKKYAKRDIQKQRRAAKEHQK